MFETKESRTAAIVIAFVLLLAVVVVCGTIILNITNTTQRQESCVTNGGSWVAGNCIQMGVDKQ